MTHRRAAHAGALAAIILLALAAFIAGNPQYSFAEPLGSDIVCRVYTTLTNLGDPIPVLIGENCPGRPPPPPPPPAACADGLDNDGDGLIDSADPGCADSADVDEADPPSTAPEEGHLVVVKVVVNDDGGTAIVSDFSLSIATTSADSAETIGVSSGATTTLSAGTWKVQEQQKEGYTGSFSGDCDASGLVTVVTGETKTCVITNDDDAPEESGPPSPSPSPAPPTGGGGGGGGSGGGGSGGLAAGTTLYTSTSTGSVGAGLVLGAYAAFSTTTESCDRYLTAFIRAGQANDVEQVKRLQRFLRDFEGASVAETGTYDGATIAAVHGFQTKYAAEILTPWGITESTGYMYLTTRKKVNEIFCGYSKTFFLTVEESQKIEQARSMIAATPPLPTTDGISRNGSKQQIAQSSSATTASATVSTSTSQGQGMFKRSLRFMRGLFDQSRR